MAQPEASLFGFPIWGLGVILYAPNQFGGFVIGHDGSNAPAINTTARIDPATGDGLVILLTGAPTLATEIGGEWTFWNVGEVDWFAIRLARDQALQRIIVGWLVILALAIWLSWRARRRAALSLLHEDRTGAVARAE